MNHWQCTLEGNVTMPEIGLQSFSKNSFRKLLRWHPKKEDPNVMKRQDAKRKEKKEQNCFTMIPKSFWIISASIQQFHEIFHTSFLLRPLKFQKFASKNGKFPSYVSGSLAWFVVTPARTHFIRWLKSKVLKSTFLTKNDGEKWSRIFYFEIQQAPSELLLPSAKKICPERMN